MKSFLFFSKTKNECPNKKNEMLFKTYMISNLPIQPVTNTPTPKITKALIRINTMISTMKKNVRDVDTLINPYTDEFGRDITTRAKKLHDDYERIVKEMGFRDLFKGKSWAEVEYELEEQEEEARQKELKKMDAARQQESKNADYELEEGEIFE